ncbi:UDP-N-acetyl-D-glucosamine dehydrogenase [Granulicella pectinivorans]|uniref:UDP-N-acetyl-D-glucosamine dehydrogenase n=1 Tax=Granulicella pectinivorans TaxID=474950 RepID=A0A1I6MMD4_9BACT|nr:nucleotide sugar dehydrogenase [Granulicella pectinivorans]SFS16814.1 UDP-N-acetyl-D-glucosamine dehydrogenase [Granulicella pectinivorans]
MSLDNTIFFDASSLSSSAAERLGRLQARTARIGVIGLGYVGLPLTLLLAEAGFQVTGFDIDEKKIGDLEAGRSYIFRIPEEEIQAARAQGLRATSDFSRLAEQDAILMCVPTPLTSHREPDLSYIENTARATATWIREGQLVVLESTTYPGTTEDVLIPLLESGNPHGLRAQTNVAAATGEGVFYVAFSPEREDPGNTTVARRDIPKVVGGHDPIATHMAATLYEGIFEKAVRVSTTRVAEMTKLLENIYRCVNIALVNELKVLSLRMDVNIWEVIDAASTKPFGFHPFYPGPGLGGHCIPIDPFYLSWKAKEYDFNTRFIELAGEVNEGMPEFVTQQVAKALNREKKALNGSKILMLGMSYKRNIDDLRESPSLTIIELLRAEGAEVLYNDPYHPTVGRGRHYNLNMTSTPLDNLSQYDCVLIVTDHSDYDYQQIVNESKLVVDTRNATKGIASTKIVLC